MKRNLIVSTLFFFFLSACDAPAGLDRAASTPVPAFPAKTQTSTAVPSPQPTRLPVPASNVLHITLAYEAAGMLGGPHARLSVLYTDTFLSLPDPIAPPWAQNGKDFTPVLRFRDISGQPVYQLRLLMRKYQVEAAIIDLPPRMEWEMYMLNDARYACLELVMPPDFRVTEDSVKFEIDPPLDQCAPGQPAWQPE